MGWGARLTLIGIASAGAAISISQMAKSDKFAAFDHQFSGVTNTMRVVAAPADVVKGPAKVAGYKVGSAINAWNELWNDRVDAAKKEYNESRKQHGQHLSGDAPTPATSSAPKVHHKAQSATTSARPVPRARGIQLNT